jgi:5-methylcytosine-specific restriction endonuclease McrA
MKKKDREIIFNRFGGKCYLCGDQLKSGWHADHLVPCRRKWKIIPAHLAGPIGYDGFGTVWVPMKNVPDGYENPEANHIDNMMPACASCNINKHSLPLESFRELIQGFMKHLNGVSTQYKLAKRYSLVQETEQPVIFYFETLQE